MKLVEALDSFLYQGLHVNTGNKVNVEEKDIPKLVEAQKISPQYLEKPPENQPDKFLKVPKKSAKRKK